MVQKREPNERSFAFSFSFFFFFFISEKMVLGGGIENFKLWFQNYVRIARVNHAIKWVSVWGTRQHWGGQVWSHASWHQTIKWDAEQILESFEPPANQCCIHSSWWSVTLVQIMVSLGDINKGIATINNNFIRFACKAGLSGVLHRSLQSQRTLFDQLRQKM